MSQENIFFIIIILFLIFLPIILYIIYYQKEYKREDEDPIRLKLSFVSRVLIFNMVLTFLLSIVFLYISYTVLWIKFSYTNLFVGTISFFFSVLFILPVANTYIHLLKECRREIYYFKSKKVLLIIENDIETIFDLENSELDICYSLPKHNSKYQTNIGKYILTMNNQSLAISDVIHLPSDFIEGQNIKKVKVSKLFISI